MLRFMMLAMMICLALLISSASVRSPARRWSPTLSQENRRMPVSKSEEESDHLSPKNNPTAGQADGYASSPSKR